MKKSLGVLFLAIVLVGCGQQDNSGERSTPTALDAFTTSFAQDHQKASKDFGFVGITDETSITTTDCMVFDQASKQAIPTSLGRLAALQQSLEIRLLMGCSENVPLGLAQYETARRALRDLYANTLKDKTQSEKILIERSKEALFVQKQINNVANEVLACRANVALEKRKTSRGTLRLEKTASTCAPDTLGASDYEENCTRSWQNAQAQEIARGRRDELSFLSELISRYRMTLLSCYPTATQEYLAFHKTVPPQLFKEAAIRFAYPLDPVMRCAIQDTALTRSKGHKGTPTKDFYECAGKLGMEALYRHYMIPDMFNADMLQGKGDFGDWLINPKKMNLEPNRWQLNDCQKTLAAYLVQNGYNLVQPEALALYCRVNSR